MGKTTLSIANLLPFGHCDESFTSRSTSRVFSGWFGKNTLTAAGIHLYELMNAQKRAHLSAHCLHVSRPTRDGEQKTSRIPDKRQSFSFSSSFPFSPLSLRSEPREVTVHNTMSLVRDVLGQGAPRALEQLRTAEIKGARGDGCRLNIT